MEDAQEGASIPRVSVIVPAYGQAAFIRRALDSLLAQTMPEWEAIVVDDGSPDDTAGAVAPFLADGRVRYLRFARNQGLGRVLNVGLQAAYGWTVAYLPADDVYYPEHLAELLAALEGAAGAVLASSGVRYAYNKMAAETVPGEPLQLVQVLHARTPDRWLERSELTTDDLDRMFWAKLRQRGSFVSTGRVSCEWVDHPLQRHKLLREPMGGINRYRAYYGVRDPLRVQTTMGQLIDEPRRFRHYRERPPSPAAADGLRILLVGELAYNADRVLALEERGHRLCGLWMPDPYWFNTVGPLPFGHVLDLAYASWRDEVRHHRPDLIYALLNWQAVPFAHRIMTENPGIPFVWHFKEGPFICLEKGMWRELVELYERADGRIFTNAETRDWFDTVVPGLSDRGPSLLLDGDLPKRDWFTDDRSPRLDRDDGAVHTVVPGRPIGVHPQTMAELAAENVHLHFYGEFTHGQWTKWIETTSRLAPDHLHLHANVDQDGWVREFSRYDAGWLHTFPSENGGELRRANWDDLNYPARLATLAAAGLPMIQRDNAGAIVATQSLVRAHDLGIFYREIPDLAAQLRDTARLERLRANVWRERDRFTFDHHADRLVDFFRAVVDGAHRREPRAAPAMDVVVAQPSAVALG